jgi:AcrB/AcrD/AcrF family
MTSFAFILGVVPLVIATGAGAEMRQALGTAVFFGMLGVTFFGLVFTPIFTCSCAGLVKHFAKLGGTDRSLENILDVSSYTPSFPSRIGSVASTG